jgi:NAD(P)H-flavin reductase
MGARGRRAAATTGRRIGDRTVAVDPAASRTHRPDWSGYTRRVDAALLAEVAWSAAAMPLAYVCGPTSFVEAVSQVLVQAGYPPERFGATGGT